MGSYQLSTLPRKLMYLAIGRLLSDVQVINPNNKKVITKDHFTLFKVPTGLTHVIGLTHIIDIYNFPI